MVHIALFWINGLGGFCSDGLRESFYLSNHLVGIDSGHNLAEIVLRLSSSIVDVHKLFADQLIFNQELFIRPFNLHSWGVLLRGSVFSQLFIRHYIPQIVFYERLNDIDQVQLVARCLAVVPLIVVVSYVQNQLLAALVAGNRKPSDFTDCDLAVFYIVVGTLLQRDQCFRCQ